eukprot:276894-Rhodomonas_salina.1
MAARVLTARMASGPRGEHCTRVCADHAGCGSTRVRAYLRAYGGATRAYTWNAAESNTRKDLCTARIYGGTIRTHTAQLTAHECVWGPQGQQHPVAVTRFVTKGTIEERMFAELEKEAERERERGASERAARYTIANVPLAEEPRKRQRKQVSAPLSAYAPAMPSLVGA